MGEIEVAGASPLTPLGERRQVSVLFADMVGFTAISERLGEEGTFVFVRTVYDKLAAAVRQEGGTVRGFAGDSIMALFGVPNALEDAPLRACRAALSIHAALAAAGDEIEARFGTRPTMRIGVSSGLAVVARVEDESAGDRPRRHSQPGLAPSRHGGGRDNADLRRDATPGRMARRHELRRRAHDQGQDQAAEGLAARVGA
jgi:Adenylate and Guanylate cyclase catalytic domain